MGANLVAIAALWAWPLVVLLIFSARPAREAVLASFLLGWLFLPSGISFNLPGLPDWTKTTATVLGVCLGALTFDSARLFAFRPRWYDVPVAVWCLCPFASSITSGQGPYDGLSAILDHIFAWGLPYLIGRVYFADGEGGRRLLLGIAVGGLVYIPFCFFEMRMSQILRGWVYGIGRFEGTRDGGYRPAVFLTTGLELGMWMTMASLGAQRLWASGAVRQFKGYSFGLLTLGLMVTTALCRATGALALLGVGLLALWLSRLSGKSLPIWLLLVVSPLYSYTRTTGSWSGGDAVEFARSTVGAERAQSLEFRFKCEDNHIVECLKRPTFGYSRTSGYIRSETGQWTKSVVDGYWLIALGTMGMVGLTAFNAMLLLPMGLTLSRYRAKDWGEPDVAPVVALGLIVVLFAIDSLSNAMPNPIYAMMMGGVSGMRVIRGGSRGKADAALGRASALAEEGRPAEADESFRLAIELTSGPSGTPREALPIRAEALEGLATLHLGSGDPAVAEEALREALAARLDLTSGDDDPDRLVDLAAAHEALARLLAEAGRPGEAIAERRKALDLRDVLVAARPRDLSYRDLRVDALNDLAWLLAVEADGPWSDPEAAVGLATRAAREAPGLPACWNTLGVARYRAGDWPGAVEALEHSVALGPPGGDTAFDHYFLSMACRRLGEIEDARGWFDRAVAWSERHRPGHPRLASFRAEAAACLTGTAGKSLQIRRT